MAIEKFDIVISAIHTISIYKYQVLLSITNKLADHQFAI